LNERAETGAAHEAAALAMLREAGLALLARNVRCRVGEIDLVLRDGRTTVFCEVRYRRSSAHGGALASVDYRKQARLTRAARWYLARHPALAREACRFDVVAIEGLAPYRVEWLRDAFQPDN
jgi:putative endonuclease